MFEKILIGLALFFLIEGLLPFVSPQTYKRTIVYITQSSDSALRIMGLVSMLTGLGLVVLFT